jgi:3-hydroxyisobutyrate dehydrogenase-like beta-hydroxyacid dehydrogenase
MSRLAVFGTGLLGSGFAQNLRKKGHDVVVWNRTLAKARPLEAVGCTVAETPAAAATGVERLHLILSDDAAVDAVLEAIAAGHGGHLPAQVVDHTTVTPAGVVRRAAKWGDRYLHAPVFMGPKNAADATGSMMVAGPRAVVEPLLPVLQTMTGKVVDLGERVDLPAVWKLCGNGMLLSIVSATSDILEVARGAGADPAQMLEMFTWFDVAPMIRFRGQKMAKGEYTPATFELQMARKDVRLMLETAASDHVVVLPAIAARMDELLAAGQGHEDYSVVGRKRT